MVIAGICKIVCEISHDQPINPPIVTIVEVLILASIFGKGVAEAH